MIQMTDTHIDHLSFSAGQKQFDFENRVYSRAEMRAMEIDTSDYCFLTEAGDFHAQLLLKAEARDGMLRAFFRFEDGRKIITPIFWWQKRQGLWDIPVGTWLLLHYGLNTKGGIYLLDAERLEELK